MVKNVLIHFFIKKTIADDAILIAKITNENSYYKYQYFLPSVLPDSYILFHFVLKEKDYTKFFQTVVSMCPMHSTCNNISPCESTVLMMISPQGTQ